MLTKKLDKLELVAEMQADCSIEIMAARAIYGQLRPYIGKTIIINIREYESKRSDKQNRWYWGVAIPIIKQFRRDTEGEEYTNDEIHYYNLTHVAGRKPVIKEIFGFETIVMEGKSTSEMSTKDFMDFKESLQKHFGEMDCNIPDPKDDNFITEYVNENVSKIKLPKRR